MYGSEPQPLRGWGATTDGSPRVAEYGNPGLRDATPSGLCENKSFGVERSVSDCRASVSPWDKRLGFRSGHPGLPCTRLGWPKSGFDLRLSAEQNTAGISCGAE